MRGIVAFLFFRVWAYPNAVYAFHFNGGRRIARLWSTRLSSVGGDPFGMSTRRNILETTAAAIQGSYWAQFADDTYTGKRGVMVEDGKKDRDSPLPTAPSSSSSPPPRPYAPTEALVPATRVRLLLESMLDPDTSMQQMQLILQSPYLVSSEIRRAFNTYTANLRFGEAYTLNASGMKRKELIRNDALPDVKTVITADLDLRDLQRNSILTNVDDLRAEVNYQLRQPTTRQDPTEAQRILNDIVDSLTAWFGYIGEEDVRAAVALYKTRS